MSLLLAASSGASATGTLAWTEENDVTAIAATVSQNATLAWTEDNDVCAVAATVSQDATLAWTEADDVTAITADVSVDVTLAWVEEDDVTAINATVQTVTVPLGGHFAFDEKKRGKRWKKEKEERDRRREVLVEAFQGLPAEVKPVAVEAITGTAAVTIDWTPIIADLERFHAAIMQMAIAKAARQDEDDIAELIEMGVL